MVTVNHLGRPADLGMTVDDFHPPKTILDCWAPKYQLRTSTSLKSDHNASGAMDLGLGIAGHLAAVAKIASIDEYSCGIFVRQKVMLEIRVPSVAGS